MAGQQLQWLRELSLVVKDPSNKGFDLGVFKVQFEIRQWELSSPKNLVARVYNVGPQVVKQITQQATRVILSGGYAYGQSGTLFDGQIRYFRAGRENNVNTYLDIFAADGDVAYYSAVINETLIAGVDATTYDEQLNRCLKVLEAYGVTRGFIDTLNTTECPRGIVLNEPVRDVLSRIARDSKAMWYIEDRQLNIVTLQGYRQGPVITLTSETGLIGRAEQTMTGIRGRCLLNPNIKMGRLLQLDNKTINASRSAAGSIEAGGSAPGGTLSGVIKPFNRWMGWEYLADEEADGTYRVIYVEHHGDTRGTDFYTDFICLGLTDVVPFDATQRGLG